MHVAGVQLDIAWENKRANHDRVRTLVAGVPKGALIVLPEMFSTGFSMNVPGIAEGEARETETFLASLAREREAYVLGGVVTARTDGKGLNQALVLDPQGKELVRYTKIHPFSFAGETNHYAQGTGVLLFPLGGFTVAPFVCYDLRFPEIFRNAVRRGAQLFTVIANWPAPREAHWVALLKARAIENQAYVVGVNRCGKDPKLAYSGRSLIVDPKGEVLADAGNSEGVIAADLDVAPLLEYRKTFPALDDMKL